MKKLLLILYLFTGLSSAQSIDSILKYYDNNHISNPEKAKWFLERGIQLAEKKHDKNKKAIFLVKLIAQKTSVRDYDGAFKRFYIARKYAIDNNIKLQEACAYSEIAETCYYKEDLDQALKYFQIAGKLFAKIDDKIGVVISKSNMSDIYQIKGKYDFAIINLLEATKSIDTTQYLYIKTAMFNNIAILYRKIDDYKKSEQSVRKALKCALNDKANVENLSTSYILLADLLQDRKAYKESEMYLDKEEKLIDSLSLYPQRFDLLKSKGSLNVSLKKYEAAKNILQEALVIGKKYNRNKQEFFSLKSNLAFCYLKTNESNKAILLYEDLLKEAKEDSRMDDISKTYLDLSNAYSKNGNYKKAYENHTQFVIYNDSILGKEKHKFFMDAEVKYQTAKKEKLLAENKTKLLKKDAEAKQRNSLIIGLLLLAVFLCITGFLIYRQQKLKNQQQEQEFELKSAISKIETQNKLQEQRLQISRDLHDNIGSQLTFIISSVDNIKYAFEIQNSKLDSKLSSISNFAKSTIVELRDTIWAMNNSEITLEDLQTRIHNFIDKAKEAKEEIVFTFNIDKSLTSIKFTSIEGMNIYRTIQEAINNSMKYADSNQIDIDIIPFENDISITIQDNGKGFDSQHVDLGNGIANMKKRIEEIGGKIHIDSNVGIGTEINITLPK
ncbi:sensor histidine kinase [Flavobacterium paronense]|uniref:Oxygen sensor histidine kinase NreB n=1 Tax=Flavobacterium paronense TaxID=1392775 RepID=A0ABV5GDJ8_9FLAO|nr:sensor histidine kinase [Flavobacterium paronense]MDN3678009.1 sensor histidine kinase [Flavobacterium paronense]